MIETNSLRASDGTLLHTLHSLPDTPPKAIVLIVHGFGEHARRYDHVTRALVADGYIVYALDHRGHGKSEGKRFAANTVDPFVNDLHQFALTIHVQHPALKLFILGHSMGSIIALAYTLRYQQELAGLIVTGVAISSSDTQPQWLLSVAKIARHIVPDVYGVDITQGQTDALSRDPQVHLDWHADPLTNRNPMRIGLGMALHDASMDIRAHLDALKLPLLTLHGGDDPVTPKHGCEMLYAGAAATDKTIKIYPGMRHEILNEVDKAVVIQDIITWLNAHI